jgi:hypothetical protein
MQSLLIAAIIFSIFCFAGKSDAAAKKSDNNDASDRVNAPGVNEYLVATLEVETTLTSQDDGVKVQKLAYNVRFAHGIVLTFIFRLLGIFGGGVYEFASITITVVVDGFSFIKSIIGTRVGDSWTGRGGLGGLKQRLTSRIRRFVKI